MILNIKSALESINPDRNLILKTELLLRSNDEKRKIHLYKCLTAAACLLFIISALSIAVYGYCQCPVYYIDVDINPSLELGVNDFERVVEVRYFNDDAEELIKEDALSGRKADEAVLLILSAASDNGYINKGEASVISLAASGKIEDKAETLLQNCINSIAGQYEDVAVYSTTISSELREEAESSSISTGKLLLIKMIQMLDKTATIEEFRNYSLTSIFDRLTYLTSDANTGASDDCKISIINGLQNVTAEISRIQKRQQAMKG